MEELIDRIIRDFDFETVHKAMLAVNWCWYNKYSEHLEVVSVGDLVLCAQKLLQTVSKGAVGCSMGTGGFMATKIDSNDMGKGLRLEFVLEESEHYLNEED